MLINNIQWFLHLFYLTSSICIWYDFIYQKSSLHDFKPRFKRSRDQNNCVAQHADFQSCLLKYLSLAIETIWVYFQKVEDNNNQIYMDGNLWMLLLYLHIDHGLTHPHAFHEYIKYGNPTEIKRKGISIEYPFEFTILVQPWCPKLEGHYSIFSTNPRALHHG